ncbi:endoglucanase A precursor, partial [Aureobasidium melanogenum]
MKFLTAAAVMLGVASAAPTATIEKRAQQCGQWDSKVTGAYTLYQDLWGISGYTGSQCSDITSLSGNTLNWWTTWSWSGGSSQVKSYANVVTKTNAVQISKIKSLATKWTWTQTGSNVVADVAYDIFTSSTAGGKNEYEIMVWLAALGGAGPISATGSPIATVTVAGHSWKLWYGSNGVNEVYSFTPNGANVSSFSGDLMDFFSYLIKSQGFKDSQYLVSVGAGTEPFTGSNAKLTSSYSLVPAYK